MAREKLRLTVEQIKRLKDLESDIVWLDDEIRRAEYVGLDVADLKARFEKTKSVRERMLEEYGK